MAPRTVRLAAVAAVMIAALAAGVVLWLSDSPDATGAPTPERSAGSSTSTTPGDGPEVSVADHGAVGDGTTDDTLAFREALADAAADGGTVSVPAGTYLVSDTIDIPADVAEIVLADDAVVRQSIDAPVFVRRGEVGTGPAEVGGAGQGADLVTVTDADAEVAAGDWVVLASEVETNEDKGFRLGSLRRIEGIGGDAVQLDRQLHRDLGDRVTAWTIELAPPVRISGGVIEHAAPEEAFAPLVLLEWVSEPVLDGVEIRECGGSGVKTVGTVGGSLDVDVHDCLDDHDGERFGSGRHYGYGVEATGPTRDLVVTGTAEAVRHAFTTNGSFPMDDDRLVNVGEPENVDVSMDVRDTTSSGLDTHELGYDIRFHDCHVRDAGRYAQEGSNDGREGGFGIFIRTSDTIVENCEITGSAVTGIVVAAPADGVDPWPAERAPVITETVVQETRGRTGVELKQNAVLERVRIVGGHEFGVKFDPGAGSSVVRDSIIDLSGDVKSFAFVQPRGARLQGNTIRTDEQVFE